MLIKADFTVYSSTQRLLREGCYFIIIGNWYQHPLGFFSSIQYIWGSIYPVNVDEFQVWLCFALDNLSGFSDYTFQASHSNSLEC